MIQAIKNKYLILCVLCATVTSCEKQLECLKGTGNIIKEERELTDFKRVLVIGFFNLYLTPDTVNKLTIEGSEHIMEYVTSNIHGDSLYIKDGSPCRWSRDYEKMNLYLHYKELYHLITDYPVKVISTDTMQFDKFIFYSIGEIGEAKLLLKGNIFDFYTSHNTLGHFYFNGEVNSSIITIHYGTVVFADSLYTQSATVNNSSIGDIYVNAAQELNISIFGTGNVYYYGDPNITITEHSGKGSIININ